jgi:hypothetical protein
MGGRERHLEAGMGTQAKWQEQRNRMVQSTGWAAGIGITLVEMQYGMDYVLTHVVGHVTAIVGWLPVLSLLAKQICG